MSDNEWHARYPIAQQVRCRRKLKHTQRRRRKVLQEKTHMRIAGLSLRMSEQLVLAASYGSCYHLPPTFRRQPAVVTSNGDLEGLPVQCGATGGAIRK
jgi:hypothetical protein